MKGCVLSCLLALISLGSLVSQDSIIVARHFTDIERITSSSNPQEFIAFGNKVIFKAHNGNPYATTNLDLWITNDALTDCDLLEERIGVSNIHNNDIVLYEDKFLFSAPGSGNLQSQSLWISDGTQIGTSTLLEFGDEENHKIEQIKITEDNRIFFTSGQDNSELWTGGGNIAYTKVFNTASSISILLEFGYNIFFEANKELYSSNGTVEGTKVIYSPLGDNIDLKRVADKVIFWQDSILWISNGSKSGTKAIFSSEGKITSSLIIEDEYYFVLEEEECLNRLFKLDSEVEEISLLEEQCISENNIRILTGFKGKVCFAQDDEIRLGSNRGNVETIVSLDADKGVAAVSSDKFILLRTDDGLLLILDSTGSTTLLKEAAYNSKLLYKNNLFFFSYRDGCANDILWTTDGTLEGTFPLPMEINLSNLTTYETIPATGIQDGIITPNFSGSYGEELGFTNATTQGTRLVKDIRNDSNLGDIVRLLPFKDRFLVEVFRSSKWKFLDLDLNGKLIKEISQDVGQTIMFKGNLYYSDREVDSLMVYRFEDRCTEALCKISNLHSFTISDDKLFFRNSNQLWVTEGDEASTRFLASVLMGSGSTLFPKPYRPMIPIFDGIIVETYATNNRGVWRSDGTVDGTYLISDLKNVSAGISYKGNAYFVAETASGYFRGIWKSDGTEEGTVTFNEEGSSQVGKMINIDSFIYYLADNKVRRLNIESNTNEIIYDDAYVVKINRFKDGLLMAMHNTSYFDDYESKLVHYDKATDNFYDIAKFDFSPLNIAPRITNEQFSYRDFTYDQTLTYISTGTVNPSKLLKTFPAIYSNSRMYSGNSGDVYFLVQRQENVYDNNVIYKLEDNTTAQIEGTIFLDENENGLQEINEIGLKGIEIKVKEIEKSVYSTEQGLYRIFLPDTGSYSLELIYPECYYYEQSNNLSNIDVSNISTKIDLDIPFVADQTETQAFINIVSQPFRCSEYVETYLTVNNSGCGYLNGKIIVSIDAKIDSFNFNDSTMINENLFIIQVDSLFPSESRNYRMDMLIPNANFLDSLLIINASLYEELNSEYFSIDSFEFFNIIKCSFDPNDKQVLPRREEPSGSNYTAKDEELIYTIRFQNNGNDTAYQVRIEDVLSKELDWSTFKTISGSHPYFIERNSGGEISVTFDRILLPDSTRNFKESQGYFSFKIMPKGSIEDFKVVENQANIYFDYNEAILTNTVKSTIVHNLDSDQDGFNFYEDCEDTDSLISPKAMEIANNGIDENCDGEDLSTSTVESTGNQVYFFPNPATSNIVLKSTIQANYQVDIFSMTSELLLKTRLASGEALDIEAIESQVLLIKMVNLTTAETSIHKILKL